jgi:hypothetical protein
MSDESHSSVPSPTQTEITAEIALLTKQQSDAREKRIFIGLNVAEMAAYESRTEQIGFLRNQLLEFLYRQDPL